MIVSPVDQTVVFNRPAIVQDRRIVSLTDGERTDAAGTDAAGADAAGTGAAGTGAAGARR